MSDLFACPSLSGQSWFGLMMVVGYPALVLAALEVARSVDERDPGGRRQPGAGGGA